MTNVLCVRALQALRGLNQHNQLHLGPPHTLPPVGPAALSSALGPFLICAVEVPICSSIMALFGCGCQLSGPCLADCFPCLLLDLPYRHGLAWQSQDNVWTWSPSPELILTWLFSLTSSPWTPLMMWTLGWSWLQPWACPAHLAQVLRGRAVAGKVIASNPTASPVISNTWKLDKCSSGCFIVRFLFLCSGEIERVGY